MIRLLFVSLVILPLAGLAQTLYWTEQFPKLARPGQSIRVQVRCTADITRMVFTPESGVAGGDFRQVSPGLFEIAITAPPLGARHLFQRFVGTFVTFSGSTQNGGSSSIVLRYAEGLPAVRVTNVSSDAQRSDYVFNLHSPQFFSQLINSAGQLAPGIEAPAKRMYQLLGDDYDFLSVVNGTLNAFENRYHSVVRNSTTGLGLTRLDGGAQFGSARRLLGFTVFPNATIFDGGEDGYVHEHGHQWIQFSGPPYRVAGSHWPLSSMATGVMGYSSPQSGQGLQFPCRFLPQANGEIRIQRSTEPRVFTDLDLYLMGLLSPEEAAPGYLVTDSAKITAALTASCAGLGTALLPGEYRAFSPQDLIQVNGARVPAAANAQKDFRTVHLVLSRDGLLSAEEMAYFEVLARRAEERGIVPYNTGRVAGFSSPWHASTRGKSVLTAKLSTNALPVISYGGVVNAASFAAGGLGPSAVATIFGTDLAASTESAASVPLPQTLGGVQVMVNGRPAPLFFVSAGQINFQLPETLGTVALGADPAHLAAVHVERGGVSSNLAFLESRAAAPGVIAYGDGYAVATKTDGSVVGPANRARPGDTLTLYWVGAAPLDGVVPAGEPAPLDRLIRVTGSSVLRVGGAAQAVSFLGVTPGGVGLLQANFQLGNLPAGEQPLVLDVGGRASNTVKLPVER